MHDFGVSLHAHNRQRNFFDAARTVNGALGGLEMNPNYLVTGFNNPDVTDAPIRNVARTIPQIYDGQTKFLLMRTQPFNGTLEDYATLAVHRLLNHLRNHWDASRPTLFLHSSGWDCRILSHSLVKLRDEGFNLGDIHFRCRPPEEESFLHVMKHQGWSPDQYSVFEAPDKDPMDVGVWERPGASPWLPVTSQINFWRDIVPYEDEKNWNLIGGSGGGEACEYPSLGKDPSIHWTFCENAAVQRWWSYFPDGTDILADVEARFGKILYPYFGNEHIKTVAQQNPEFLGFQEAFHVGACDNIRAAMMRKFDNHTLDIPRQGRRYSWGISDERWNDMRTKYERSIFVKEVPNAPSGEFLLYEMQRCFFTRDSWAERIWRLAALWEAVRA